MSRIYQATSKVLLVELQLCVLLVANLNLVEHSSQVRLTRQSSFSISERDTEQLDIEEEKGVYNSEATHSHTHGHCNHLQLVIMLTGEVPSDQREVCYVDHTLQHKQWLVLAFVLESF